MADEPDGVNEVYEGALRVGLTVAGRMAEVAARARERASREAEAAGLQEARELQARLDAERGAARASLAPVERSEWWITARPEQVAAAWETAQAWSQVDPDARRAGDRIREEVRQRYGVDVGDARPEPGALREALAAREQAEGAAGRQQAQARREVGEAAGLMTDAARADHQQDQDAGPVLEPAGQDHFDSAERREELAACLDGVVDAEAAEARVLADTSQGRPAAEALRAAPAKAPRARRQRGVVGRGSEQQKTLSR